GDREQHRLLLGLVRVAHPRRHHEYVVRAPLERLVADLGGALALDADEHGAVGRAIGLALEAFRQQREVGAHGRQHRSAVDRVDCVHTLAVVLFYVAGLLHALDDRARTGVGVVDDRAALRTRQRAVRQPPRAVEGERVAVAAAGRLGLAGKLLGERG